MWPPRIPSAGGHSRECWGQRPPLPQAPPEGTLRQVTCFFPPTPCVSSFCAPSQLGILYAVLVLHSSSLRKPRVRRVEASCLICPGLCTIGVQESVLKEEMWVHVDQRGVGFSPLCRVAPREARAASGWDVPLPFQKRGPKGATPSSHHARYSASARNKIFQTKIGIAMDTGSMISHADYLTREFHNVEKGVDKSCSTLEREFRDDSPPR